MLVLLSDPQVPPRLSEDAMPEAFGNQTTRWGKVEGWWLHHPDTDADHICMLAALSTYTDDRGTCYPSQATLARHVKRSRPWVNRVIAELTAIGLIRKTARTRTNNAGTTSCEYRLVDRCEALDNSVIPVTEATEPSHDGDTPSHGDDTTQLTTKQEDYARPATHQPMHDRIPERMVRPLRSSRVDVPADWKPSEFVMARATLLCPDTDLHAHIIKFVSRCRSKGYLYQADARDDAWLSWLAEDALKEKAHAKSRGADERTRPRGTTSESGDRRFTAWAAAASVPRLERESAQPSADNPWN